YAGVRTCNPGTPEPTGISPLFPPDRVAAVLQLRNFPVEPLLELVRRKDRHERAHTVVAQTAELRAGDLVLEVLVARALTHLRGRDTRDEPDRDRQARNRILLHTHFRHVEAVDDVLAPQFHDDRAVRRQIELVDGRHVILGVRVGAV